MENQENQEITLEQFLSMSWGPFTVEKQENQYGEQLKIWRDTDVAMSICIDEHFKVEKTDTVIRLQNDNINLTLWEAGIVALTDYTNVNKEKLTI